MGLNDFNTECYKKYFCFVLFGFAFLYLFLF